MGIHGFTFLCSPRLCFFLGILLFFSSLLHISVVKKLNSKAAVLSFLSAWHDDNSKNKTVVEAC